MRKTYLVIGASRGIGQALAQNLETHGHYVVGVSRTPAQCEHWLQADVTTDDGLDAIARYFTGKKIDSLLYMAGAWEENAVTQDYNFLASTRSETRQIMALNLVAPILLSQTLATHLSKADTPKIILMGSTSGLDEVRCIEVAYTASKFGLRGVSQSLAIALKPLNIEVAIINPGDVATPEVIEDCIAHGISTEGLIPISDVIKAINLVMESSSHSVPIEINLFDKR